MKAHSRNHIEWLGQARDPIWTKMAREKNNAIIKKWAQKQKFLKGSVPVELVCFIIVLSLFVGLMLWLIKVVFETALISGVWLGSHI